MLAITSRKRVKNMDKLFSLSPLICLFLQCSICYSWKNLEFLDLGSNLLEGPLPSSLCKMENLQYLLLSDNKLSGTIPGCLVNMSTQLTVLDLKRNGFHGKIPVNFPAGTSLRNLGLTGNQLEGPLPKSLFYCEKLEVLDVGHNKIRDTFPVWLENLPVLSVLVLTSNQFYGTIRTTSKTSFQKLRILDLSLNQFSGILPAQMVENFQAMKKNGNQTQRQYMGDSSYYEDSVTVVMKDLVVEMKRILTIFTTIDLSQNFFEGSIPNSIGDLNSLTVLNFSHNQFNGSIPSTFRGLSALESLDLSSNQLWGRIPDELEKLNFLGTLNLSFNRLVGRIPTGGQFYTFKDSAYEGNAGLCGFPLADCGEPAKRPSQSPWSQNQTDLLDLMMRGLTWESVLLGFGFGMMVGLLMGGLPLHTQKPKWFHAILEDICEQLKERPRKEALNWHNIRKY